MISSFSDTGYLILARPHPRSCFFKQTVFQRQVGNAFLERTSLSAQILDLITGRSTSSIARQSALAGFHELLGPGVIQALRDAFLAAQFGNAVFAAQTIENDPDLVFS